MDPDEALKRARKALKQLRAAQPLNDPNDAAEDLADAFEALDDWLSKGGFLPQDWGKR